VTQPSAGFDPPFDIASLVLTDETLVLLVSELQQIATHANLYGGDGENAWGGVVTFPEFFQAYEIMHVLLQSMGINDVLYISEDEDDEDEVTSFSEGGGTTSASAHERVKARTFKFLRSLALGGDGDESLETNSSKPASVSPEVKSPVYGTTATPSDFFADETAAALKEEERDMMMATIIGEKDKVINALRVEVAESQILLKKELLVATEALFHQEERIETMRKQAIEDRTKRRPQRFSLGRILMTTLLSTIFTVIILFQLLRFATMMVKQGHWGPPIDQRKNPHPGSGNVSSISVALACVPADAEKQIWRFPKDVFSFKGDTSGAGSGVGGGEADETTIPRRKGLFGETPARRMKFRFFPPPYSPIHDIPTIIMGTRPGVRERDGESGRTAADVAAPLKAKNHPVMDWVRRIFTFALNRRSKLDVGGKGVGVGVGEGVGWVK
jgi:hypothetical protein